MRLWLGLVLLLGTGCGGQEEDTDTDVVVAESTGLPDGEYLLGISLAPVSGLLVPFQITIESELADDGSGILKRFDVRATDSEWGLSDVLVSLSDIVVSQYGTFEVNLEFTLPGDFSPTLSDVQLTSTLSGTITDERFFCGDVTGTLVTFEVDLEGSTFGSVPWSERDGGAASSCDDDRNATIERLDAADCPVLAEGANTEFPSGGSMRSFEVQLPANYSADNPTPVVFSWHGFGGTAAGFLAGELSAAATSHDVILVVPQGLDKGGQTSFDPFSDARRNFDLAFFDDMLTCVSERFAVDPERVYSTGMSNGGLMTGMILASRASTLAAAAPLSGGMQVAFADDHEPIPSLVVWGGAEDMAYAQDFELLSTTMIEDLLARGHFVVSCDHGLGHDIPDGGWEWSFDFLLAHERGVETSPFETALSAAFPEYCVIETEDE
jgi:predicted esterase